MRCINCPYHYKTEKDEWACCHCTEPEGLAPCEIDDEFDESEYEEEDEEDD